MSDADSTIRISDLYSLVKKFDKDFLAGREVNPVLINEDGAPERVILLTIKVFSQPGIYRKIGIFGKKQKNRSITTRQC